MALGAMAQRPAAQPAVCRAVIPGRPCPAARSLPLRPEACNAAAVYWPDRCRRPEQLWEAGAGFCAAAHVIWKPGAPTFAEAFPHSGLTHGRSEVC